MLRKLTQSGVQTLLTRPHNARAMQAVDFNAIVQIQAVSILIKSN